MDVYISGKISGKTQQEAEADFGKYAEIIQAAGHTPVNPMKNGRLSMLPGKIIWNATLKCYARVMLSVYCRIGSRAAERRSSCTRHLRSGCRFSMTRIFVCTSNKPIIREVQQEDSRSKILRNIERSYKMQQGTIKDPSQKHNL